MAAPAVELDLLIDTLAGVLREFGLHAFDLERQDARRTRMAFDAWAQHVTTGAEAPGTKPTAALSLRNFNGLRVAFSAHRKAEHAEVSQAQDALRDVVWAFIAGLNRVVLDDANDDSQVGETLGSLTQKLQAAAAPDIRKLALDAVQQVQAVLSQRRERQAKQVQDLALKLETLGSQLEVARRESSIDALTQLFNRRAFDEQLLRTSEFAALRAGGAALLLVDVDKFKAVNDTHGHPGGDAVLRAVATACVRTFGRKGDFVARYGGEEMAVLLREVSSSDAERLAEKLRGAIAELKVAHDGKLIFVTASVGVAAWHLREAPANWLARADAALYRAKENGRNRVEVDRTVPPSSPSGLLRP